MRKYDLVINGRVQGVWFRASTKEMADKLGVFGIVKNLPNGSVYAEIEGSEEAISKMLEWCKNGPPLARVESIEKTESSIVGYTDFTIR